MQNICLLESIMRNLVLQHKMMLSSSETINQNKALTKDYIQELSGFKIFFNSDDVLVDITASLLCSTNLQP